MSARTIVTMTTDNPIRSIESATQRMPSKRALAAILVVQMALSMALSVTPASGQGTVSPFPLIQYFDNTGAVLDEGGLCVFVGGSSSTLATTYTTAALSVANANPIAFNSAGRPNSGGVFLTPGSSYRFILKDFSGVVTPTCIPDTGSTIWTVDNVVAVPGSSAAVDVTGTAGESLAAGEAVFLSNGTGGLTGGLWYRTDADLTYRSTAAVMVGVSPAAVTSGTSGAMRISGTVTTSGLSTGAAYYLSGTIGAITTTPPTNAVRVGQAQSATVLVVGLQAMPIGPHGPPCGRLTGTTGTPVTVADVTAITTLFYAPYGGCDTIPTFDGTQWTLSRFTQLSIAVPAAANQMYDVFVYDNAGALALELTAWTNDTTRATALTTQNSVYVKTGVLTRLYLGSFRTTAVAGQSEDSVTKRYLWNYYHRVSRVLRVREATNSWNYNTATWRQANASTANQVDVVVGVAEVLLSLTLIGDASNSSGVATNFAVGIGEDSTTAPMTTSTGQHAGSAGAAGSYWQTTARVDTYPAIGRHFYAWLEISDANATTSWSGDQVNANNGITGRIEG